MFLVIKKKKIIISIILIAVVVIGIVLSVVGVETAAAMESNKLLPIYSVECDDNKVALTFDAAWGGDKTLQILDTLDTYGVKATFFLVGFWVDKYPELVKTIAERGHLIGNHSTNHPHFNTLNEKAISLEIETTAQKIKAITGEDVKYFRAPYGEYNDTLMRYLAANDSYGIQWDVDSLDWKGLSSKELSERILSKVRSGSIILCHNNSDHIVEALPIVLLGLKSKGLTSVRMDELVITENYYIDNNGTQHSN